MNPRIEEVREQKIDLEKLKTILETEQITKAQLAQILNIDQAHDLENSTIGTISDYLISIGLLILIDPLLDLYGVSKPEQRIELQIEKAYSQPFQLLFNSDEIAKIIIDSGLYDTDGYLIQM